MPTKPLPAGRGLPGIALVSALLLACGGEDTAAPAASSGGAAGQSAAPLCDVQIAQHPLAPTLHVAECSPLSTENFSSIPPSSGNHYPRWAAFKGYDQTIPWGYYIHSMEHGAVVFLYNCPDGCPEDIAALKTLIEQLPEDPLCTDPAGPRRRILLVPEPKISSKFAAAAWGWTLQAPCVDPSTFAAFARDHYAQATEDFCNDGVDVLAEGLQAGCGE
jgi:hypothetical protein